MRIIPKKIKIKNTVFKCYGLKEVIIILFLFASVFALITASKFALAGVLAALMIITFMPTQDGIFYTIIFENIKFIFAKKKYSKDAKNEKEKIDNLVGIRKIHEDGTIEYQGGIYGKVIKVGQKNFGIEDEEKQNIDIDLFSDIFKSLDLKTTLDIVKIDRPLKLDGFSLNLFNRLVDERNSKEKKEIKEIKAEILKERIDKIDKTNNILKQYISDYYIVVYSKNRYETENVSTYIVSQLSKISIESKILSFCDTAIFLKYSFSRNFEEREVSKIDKEKIVDWILPKKAEFKSNKYILDENLSCGSLAIADYPLRVKNAWGASIFDIPNTKVVLRIRPLDKIKAIQRIDRCIGEMETKEIMSYKASESNSAEIHKESMISLLDSLQSENEALLDVTFCITAYDYLKDENFKKKVKRELIYENFRPSTLNGNQIESFKMSFSPSYQLSKYERGINSSTLGAIFPFVHTYVMDENGIMLGENTNNSYPFIFDIWKRGNNYQNSNAMVIGKSGSGKSFFLKNLIANEYANGTRVIILDPEAEYLALTRNLYGNIINVGNAKEGRINPFHIYKILCEDGGVADSRLTFNTHLKMLESFFKIVFEGADSDVIELINNLTVETYNKMGIDENTNLSKLKEKDYPTFSDLLSNLLSKDMNKMDEMTRRDTRVAILYLEKFVHGRYSDIWNGPSTLKSEESICDFDFQSLFANKNNVVANAQMLLVFRFIEQEIINARERNKNGSELKTMIICDEAHLFIDAKFPIALDFFFSMSKRIRKYKGSFIPATQNIADWNANEELRSKTSAIIKNSQYTFIFKLSAPDMKDVLDVYSAGDSFNEEERRIIISAITGQTFFVGGADARCSVNIECSDKVKELFNENREEKN